MIYFFGVRLDQDFKPKTGGQRRYQEAFNCFGSDARSISTFRETFKIIFKKNIKIVCFDERYLLLLLPLLIVGKKVFFFPRGNKLIHFSEDYSKVRLFIYKNIFSFLYSRCYKLIFQTEAQCQEFRDMYCFKGKHSVVPNHIRATWISDLFKLKEKVYLQGDVLKVGFLGGLSNRKGFTLAYTALLPLIKEGKLELSVAGGEGNEFNNFDVNCHGKIDSLLEFYGSCHVIIIPSKYDSFPNVFLESLASSTVPFLTRDLITEDICGSTSKLLFDRNMESIHNVFESYISEENFRIELSTECAVQRSRYDFDWSASLHNVLNKR